MSGSSKCVNCGHAEDAHVGDKCPRVLSVTIDADQLERMRRTGHPRLLKNVLDRQAQGFGGVYILSLREVA